MEMQSKKQDSLLDTDTPLQNRNSLDRLRKCKTAETASRQNALEVKQRQLEMMERIAVLSAGTAASEDSLLSALIEIGRHFDCPLGFLYFPDENNPGRLLPASLHHEEGEQYRILWELSSASCQQSGFDLPGQAYTTGEP